MILQRLRYRGVVAVRGLDRVGMGFRRTVAGLAAVNVVLAGKHELRVTRLLELHHFILVAVSAPFRAGKFAGGRVILRCSACDRRSLRGLRPLLSPRRGCGASQSGSQEQRSDPRKSAIHAVNRRLLSHIQKALLREARKLAPIVYRLVQEVYDIYHRDKRHMDGTCVGRSIAPLAKNFDFL